jgi:HEPN domain-containing protein
MRKEKIKTFEERADAFLDTALYNFQNKRYDLAAFNIEQAVQLHVKTKLLELTGEFPRTHNLVVLLKELSSVFKEKEVEEFIKNEMESLTKMADIYITSRYYDREFYKEEVENLFNFAKKIKELLSD